MADRYDLEVRGGESFGLTAECVGEGVGDVVSGAASVEVRGQIRTGPGEAFPLVFDLTPFLAWQVIGPTDVRVTLTLTGAATRLVRSGHYDLILSDAGTADPHGVVLLEGRVDWTPSSTSASSS